MSVLLANDRLGLRRRIDEVTLNAHGERVVAGWGALVGVHEGRTKERSDGTWSLGLDPSLWPVRVGDLVVSMSGGAWLVQTCDLVTNNADSAVDWVRIIGLQRSVGGTEPGGAWFVARYTETVQPAPPDDTGTEIVLVQAGLWTGYGPPPTPSAEFPAKPGDEYIDLNTGTVYVLGEAT